MWVYLLFIPLGFFYFFLSVDLPLLNYKRQILQQQVDQVALQALDYFPVRTFASNYLTQQLANLNVQSRIEHLSESKLALSWEAKSELFLQLSGIEDALLLTTGYSEVGLSFFRTTIVLDIASLLANLKICETESGKVLLMAAANLMQHLASFNISDIEYVFFKALDLPEIASKVYSSDYPASASDYLEKLSTECASQELSIPEAVESDSQYSSVFLPVINLLQTSTPNYEAESNFVVLSTLFQGVNYNGVDSKLWFHLQELDSLARIMGKSVNVYWYILHEGSLVEHLRYLSDQFTNQQFGLNLKIIFTDQAALYENNLMYYAASVLLNKNILR